MYSIITSQYFRSHITMHLKLICLLVLVTVMAAAEEEKAKKKITKLQIGVKKRVPEDECDMKSRQDNK